MIDFTTALQIAHTVLSPLQQAFLQQIGKQAAAALTDRLAKLQEALFTFIVGTQRGLASSTSTPSALSQDPEELAAQILLAARRDPEAFNEVLQQYQGIKFDLDASRSTGAISASASGGSAITQNVILGGNVQIGDCHQPHSASKLSNAKVICAASAKTLLLAAASTDGRIAKAIDYDTILKAGELVVSPNASAREIAKWEAALKELISLGLVDCVPLSEEKLYQVTHRGYEFLDDVVSITDSEL